MKKKATLSYHLAQCKDHHPPGMLVYEDTSISLFQAHTKSISIYEIDGKEKKLYCQNLCLLSKLYLDHKTLYFDVTPFMFYVLTENSDDGNSHVVGYFSKDKKMNNAYNLSCILVLPPFQKKGYGKLLISFSYYLSKKVGLVCGPEKPLSDMGKISYLSYWKDIIFEELKDCKPPKAPPSIKELSRKTFIKIDDIQILLQYHNMLKYWKNEHIIESVNSKDITDHFKKKEELKSQFPPTTVTFSAENITYKEP